MQYKLKPRHLEDLALLKAGDTVLLSRLLDLGQPS